MAARDKVYYVSNKELFQVYLGWYANIKTAKEMGLDEPPIPDYICESMIKIATRLSYKPNFINYTFKEEMIGDAIYDCVRFAKKFNPEKSENPFSYITTICFNAFLRRIDKEKTQTYVKAMIVSDTADHEFLDTLMTDDTTYVNQYIEFLRTTGSSHDHLPMSMKRTKKLKDEIKGPLELTDDE